VTAPLPQAQLVESRLINLLHFQTLIASKAIRSVLVAPNKLLVDFGLRRAHGAEAGLFAARASYLVGFAGSATVLAAPLFGVPSSARWLTRLFRPTTRKASLSNILPIPYRRM
jgi:nicotinate phosphoribosyltransferase